MQFRLAYTENVGADLVIWVGVGNGWDTLVVRSSDGTFVCRGSQCNHKKEQNSCEHVRFAREQYETVISPNQEYKLARERQVALAKLEEAKAVVAKLEQQATSDTDDDPLAYKRNIVVE